MPTSADDEPHEGARDGNDDGYVLYAPNTGKRWRPEHLPPRFTAPDPPSLEWTEGLVAMDAPDRWEAAKAFARFFPADGSGVGSGGPRSA
jgi:hypothetical protein